MPAEPGTGHAPDLDLVAEIVRRAGLDCRVEGAAPDRWVRARCVGEDGPGVLVGADGWIGPASSARRRRVRHLDARRLAAIVVAQTLLPDRSDVLTHAEAGACGLTDALCWR
jgi:hypothetical protein